MYFLQCVMIMGGFMGSCALWASETPLADDLEKSQLDSLISQKEVTAQQAAMDKIFQGSNQDIFEAFQQEPHLVNQRLSDGDFPLHAAIRNNKLGLVERLVKQFKAPINVGNGKIDVTTGKDDTPLMLATRLQRLKMMELLLDFKNGPRTQALGDIWAGVISFDPTQLKEVPGKTKNYLASRHVWSRGQDGEEAFAIALKNNFFPGIVLLRERGYGRGINKATHVVDPQWTRDMRERQQLLTERITVEQAAGVEPEYQTIKYEKSAQANPNGDEKEEKESH